MRSNPTTTKTQFTLDEPETRSQVDAAGGVSVVMVSYCTGPVLLRAIDLVLAPTQEGVTELIIVNNGNPTSVSADLSLRASTDPRLRLICGQGNVGFARGCNLGAGSARARYLLFLNPDCCLSPTAIPALFAEAVELGEHWMLGCRMLNPDGTNQRGSRRSLLTPTTALVEILRLHKLSPSRLRRYALNHHDTPLPNHTVRVPAITGACMMLPAVTFRTVGGFERTLLPPCRGFGFVLSAKASSNSRLLHTTRTSISSFE